MSVPQDWKPPTLETARLIVRPIDERDADGVFAYASNPAVTRYTLWDTHQDRDDSLAFVRDYSWSRYREGVPEPMGVCWKDRPDWVIGTVGGFWTSQPNATMEVGYALGAEHWGQGVIPEAARALLGHLFAAYPVRRVQARFIVGNDASERVLQKLGMTREGRLRSALFHRNEYKDVVMYSILRDEVPQKK